MLSLLHPIRDLRRRSLLSEPFPEEWVGYIEKNVGHYPLLTSDEKTRLLNDARVFVAEKAWEAAGGHELSDEMRITIAAEACLLLLGWDDARRVDLYANVRTVIVYPTGFHAVHEKAEGPVRSADPAAELGEAWSSDLPVVLSWLSARDGSERPDDGHNVVLHEFAHKLDMLNGSADGVPPLENDEAADEWANVLSEEYALLTHDAERGHSTLLDTYGATNEAEFFAVTTEAFFERAPRMLREKPRLYEAFSRFYRQDTAARLGG